MAIQSNIEIMVQQGERWIIHARLPVTRKDEAIEEAKTLERTPGIGAVKVIKDVYDPKQGTSTEYIIYKSAGAKGGEPASPAPAKSWMDDDSPARDRRPAARPQRAATPSMPRRSRSFGSVLTRLLVVLLVSLLAASAVTATLVFSIKSPTFLGISMVGDSGANFFFAVFVVSFLLCASFMAASLLGGEGLSKPTVRLDLPTFQKNAKPKPAQAPKPSEESLTAQAPEAPPTPDEIAQLKATGFQPRSIIHDIITGRIQARHVAKFLKLPFVVSVEGGGMGGPKKTQGMK